MNRYRVALDIGGTFTDVVAHDQRSGAVAVAKASTTDTDLVDGVLAALEQVVETPADIEFLVHGTTQGLNALLERRGERVLLLATEGVGDVYHIARGSRDRLYDIRYRKPAPLACRADTFEIGGRIDAAGQEVSALDEASVRAAAGYARAEGIRSIAVALLFSYLAPEHEIAVERVLRDELGDQVSIALSHRLAREWREYERTSSTVAEAYIAPTMRTYLDGLGRRLRERGLPVPVHIMQSSGGVVHADVAREHALPTLLSGPVGCTIGGTALAEMLGRPNLICVDMGGTSFDVSLIIDGRPSVSSEAELEGLPLLMPVVDIHTIGAGGGSIAYAEGGGLRVGPASAGATPGPACYGRGGTRPTVTDANLLLGRIDPDWFAGGRLPLDRQAAETAMRGLGGELGLDVDRLAEGVCDVVNAKMAQAIRTLTVARGLDPKDFALVAVGGAGALHAAFLARELGIGEVIIPAHPGTFSAWGMLSGDLRHDESRPFLRELPSADPQELQALLVEMAEVGAALLAAQGSDPSQHRHQPALDLRYVDQAYTLAVPLAGLDEPLTAGFARAVADRFHDAHQARYGHCSRDARVEAVTVRLTSTSQVQRARATAGRVDASVVGAPEPERIASVVFDGAPRATAIYRRSALVPGASLPGPAIIVEDTATNVVPPDTCARVHPSGALLISATESAVVIEENVA